MKLADNKKARTLDGKGFSVVKSARYELWAV